MKFLTLTVSNRYKQNAEETRKSSQLSHNAGMEPYSKAFTDHLNDLVMDVVNCVWRNKGFSRADNSPGCNIQK